MKALRSKVLDLAYSLFYQSEDRGQHPRLQLCAERTKPERRGLVLLGRALSTLKKKVENIRVARLHLHHAWSVTTAQAGDKDVLT